MKNQYYKAVDRKTGKTCAMAYNLANLLKYYDFVLPHGIDVYRVCENKIM